MKRLLIFLLLWMYPVVSFSAIDEYKTDVYFANGILTSPDASRKNTTLLRDSIIAKFGIDYYSKHIGKVDYAYNRTVSKGWDLFESAYQVSNLQELVDKGYRLISETKATIHSLDLKPQVDKYEASIKNGHKVLVVAHSQGNLYTQEAYEKLGERSKNQNKWLQNYFEAVSVASPDPFSDIKPDMLPRIGWDNDLVARLGLGLLPRGIDCFTRSQTKFGNAYSN